jgi:hypothetical protein
MGPQAEHPSFLQLDRLKWDGGPESLRAHVAGCAECAAHLAQVDRRVAVPAWARALEDAKPRGWRALLSGGPRWVWGGALATVMAVLVLLVVAPGTQPLPEDPRGTYVGIKGAPTVVVHVRHGEAVSPWDGARPVIVGDSVRLEVAAQGYPQVLVGSRTQAGGFVTLYEGTLPEGGALLPASWRVDAEGDAEHLVVVLSRAALSADVLKQALSERRQTADVWVSELKLPKQPKP